MSKISENPDGSKAHYGDPEPVIDEILQSLEKVDKKIEEFYKIYGTGLTVYDDEQTTPKRGVNQEV